MGVTNRLRTDRWIAEHSRIHGEVVDRPLFLTGLPRSGTTYFQYLFNHDPAFRLLKTWETARPAPVVELSPEERAKRLAATDQDREMLRAAIPGVDAMHLSDTDGPDECHRFLTQTLGAIGDHNCQNVPSHYRAILEDFDLERVYEVHKRQLQVLQWNTDNCRWALKYPNHLIAMDDIVAVYPDASFIMTHRDPVQTLASLCKLTAAIRSSRSDHVDPLVVGRQIKQFVQVHFERMLASRRDPDMERRIIDVDYYRLVASPEVVLGEIYEKMNMEIPTTVRDGVAQWRQNNPPGKRGAYSYALEDFGLDPDAVAEEYGAYFEAFDVPREAQGVRVS